jgi:hypothetical protein
MLAAVKALNPDLIWLAVLIPFECAALWIGQRRLFFTAETALRSRKLALLIAMPGTVLHELAHFLACQILRVPAGRQVGGKVEFFHPRVDEQSGGMILGQVPHAHTDPLRGALIAIAPVLLVPPLLVGATMGLLGTTSIDDLPHAFAHAGWWQLLIWAYVALSCGQAAFPSPGDHIGILGGGCLLILAVVLGWVAVATGGLSRLVEILAAGGLLLLVPALAAGGSLALLTFVARRRPPQTA